MALTETQRKALNYLTRLRKKGPQDFNLGICDNVLLTSAEIIEVFYPLYIQWPEYSGSLIYPVPSYVEYVPAMEAYLEFGNIWNRTTKYGQARWRLLDFLIAQLEKGLS